MAASFIAVTRVERAGNSLGAQPERAQAASWHLEAVPAEDDRRLAQMLGIMAMFGVGLWLLMGWGIWVLIASLAG